MAMPFLIPNHVSFGSEVVTHSYRASLDSSIRSTGTGRIMREREWPTRLAVVKSFELVPQ